MRLDILTRLCDTRPPKLIYTIPTFHNPTGVTLPTVRRTKLLDLAQSYHCLIVEDDPFSELYYKTKPPLSIKAHDQSGHVVYIKSFSKTVAPGCRIACVAATGSVLNRLALALHTLRRNALQRSPGILPRVVSIYGLSFHLLLISRNWSAWPTAKAFLFYRVRCAMQVVWTVIISA